MLDYIKNFVKERSPRDIIYSISVAVFFLAAAFIFIQSVTFLVKNINMVVAEPLGSEVGVASFDIVTFSTIAPRLNINFNPIASSPAPPPPAPAPSRLPVAAATSTQSEEDSDESSAEEAKVEVDLTKISLRILNGTTITGLAKTWQSRFGDEGLSQIAVGNAAKRNYSGVTIQYKSGFIDFLPKIREIISQHNAKISQESEDGGGSKYDVTIIIGK